MLTSRLPSPGSSIATWPGLRTFLALKGPGDLLRYVLSTAGAGAGDDAYLHLLPPAFRIRVECIEATTGLSSIATSICHI